MLRRQQQAEPRTGELVTKIDFGIFRGVRDHHVQDGIIEHRRISVLPLIGGPTGRTRTHLPPEIRIR